jgi:26S proteasome non-ATPase regulatory subunit 9
MNTRLLTPDGFPRADLDVAQSKQLLLSPSYVFTDNFLVRTTRSRIIYLKNDYKALMNVIEKTIHEHFANLAQQPAEAADASSSQSSESRPLAARPAPTLDPAFATVNSVVPGSPAESAGLKPGDEIRNFGYVNRSNNEGLRRVADCVQGNEGVSSTSLFGSHKAVMPLFILFHRCLLLLNSANTSFQHDVIVKVSRKISLEDQRQELQLTLTPRRDWGGRGLLGCHILPI